MNPAEHIGIPSFLIKVRTDAGLDKNSAFAQGLMQKTFPFKITTQISGASLAAAN